MNPRKETDRAIRLAGHELKKIARAFRGKPLNPPPLVAATIDREDAGLARRLLKDRGSWRDSAPVEDFERAFASWNGSLHARAFMGGRVALSAVISAMGLKPGDEAILPGYTCVVVRNAFEFAGVKTVFCDIEHDTYGLDASLLEGAITPRTRVVLLHHLYGLVCRDYEETVEKARSHGLLVIEDCAQSTGASFKGRRVGNLGDAAIFSLEVSKVLTTVRGGIAVTNDQAIAQGLDEYSVSLEYPPDTETARLLRNVILDYHCFKSGNRWWMADFFHTYLEGAFVVTTTGQEVQGVEPPGYARRMSAPLARLGMQQLGKLDSYNERRVRGARRWSAWCDEKGYDKPCVVDESIPVFLRYPVMVEPERKRDLRWAMKEFNFYPGVWFVGNIHPSRDHIEGCPNADAAVERCINFPTLMD